MLNPLSIAHLGIGRKPIVAALLGIWDVLMKVLAAPDTGGGGPDASDLAGDRHVDQQPFDTPYREYVKRINAEQAAEWQKRHQEDANGVAEEARPIASPEVLDYDARVGQGAPVAVVAKAVAPQIIQDAERSIALTKQALGAITRTAAMTARQRLDDEAAMLALFALMMDDD